MKYLLASKDNQENADASVNMVREQFPDYEYEVVSDGTRKKIYLVSDKQLEGGVLESARTKAQEAVVRERPKKEPVIGANTTVGGAGGGPSDSPA